MAVTAMGWLFSLAFLLVAVGNAGIALRWYSRGKRGTLIPLIGGLAGIVACVTLPFPGLRQWWWIPLAADLGSAYLVIATIVFFVRRAWADHQSNRMGS
jgi:hypothetical protein